MRVIERKCSYTVIPWQMGIVAKLMRALPNPLFDKLFSKSISRARMNSIKQLDSR